MSMNTPVANGDPTLAALIPEGVTLGHIISLFQTAYPVNGVQLLRARLGATHPANLAPTELAEFIKYMLAAIKSAGIRDPAARLAADAELGSSAATTENPFAGQEHDGRVFRDRRERNFFIGRLPRGKKRNGYGTIRIAGKLVRNSYAICKPVPGPMSRRTNRATLDAVSKRGADWWRVERSVTGTGRGQAPASQVSNEHRAADDCQS